MSNPHQSLHGPSDCRSAAETAVSRRNFLLGSAASMAALSAVCRSSPAASQQPAMTLGFSSYGMKSLTTEVALKSIREIGFDAVELTVTPEWDAAPERLIGDRRRTVRRQLEQLGLRLTSLMEHLYPSEDEAQHQKSIERLKPVYQLARDLGRDAPPLVQTVLGGGTWEDRRNMFRDRLGDWIELGQSYGVVTCIKPHRGGAMSQPSEAIWLIEQLENSPWLRMVYDYSHYIYRDIDLLDSIKQSLPVTAHVAVKDTVMEDGKARFQLPGEAGTIDFATLLKTFHAGGYRGDISCEVSGMVWNQPGYDPLAAARICFRNMSQAFTKAGIERGRD